MAGVEGDVAEAISSPVTGEGGNATEPSSESAEGGRDVTAPAFAPTQMIDARGEFSGSMDDFASDLGGEGDMEDGLVISALGVRGSGKSSLLNAVFNTGFDVGKAFVPSKGTKGAWVEVSGVGSKPIVVMDTQGCDGRGAEMDRVNRIATFALCFSDALIFNLWYGLQTCFFCFPRTDRRAFSGAQTQIGLMTFYNVSWQERKRERAFM